MILQYPAFMIVYVPNSAMCFGKESLRSLSDPRNTKSPSVVTVSGMMTVRRFGQLLNAPSPIDSSPSAIRYIIHVYSNGEIHIIF